MHGQLPVLWHKAKDFQVYDKFGNCWIDFTSTIFVANTGHANPRVVSALKKQLAQGLLHTYTFASEIRAKFLEKLIKSLPSFCQKAFLLSSGTEATECAIKLMRMYGIGVNPEKKVIISFKGNMHGRTMGAEMLRGDPVLSDWIGYKDPNMQALNFPYPWLADSSRYDWGLKFKKDMDLLLKHGLKPQNICGFIIESYQGWGAVFYPKDYIKALCSFAKKNRALVTFDEIQGGFGRTGKLFVFQHYGVTPDLICLGKGISGSLPLSAVVGRKKIMDLPQIGSMSSTHSANPLCCAAGLANLEALSENDLVRQSQRKGKLLSERLLQLKDKYPERVFWVSVRGLLAALILKDPKTGKPDADFANKVCEKAMQKGLLLVHTGRESIKIGPPLTIPDAALQEGLDVLEECFEEVERQAR
ncbi:MAG: aspartate aminotransferase family protein [Candidatus Omnitrophica bacterium]|nr:aspartate aminotransferase family protein [Candidatus Omnitrophota bacterium]